MWERDIATIEFYDLFFPPPTSVRLQWFLRAWHSHLLKAGENWYRESKLLNYYICHNNNQIWTWWVQISQWEVVGQQQELSLSNNGIIWDDQFSKYLEILYCGPWSIQLG